MNGGFSGSFIRHPIATSLLMVGVLFVGIVVYPKLPVAPLPQVDFPDHPGLREPARRQPDTMASAVAQPLETQFAQIPGVAQMTSTSALGSTAITIQFDLDRNIDAAANDVQAAINAASGQLPKNLPTPPTYRKVNPADSPILLLGATSDTLPLTTVDDYVETKLAQQISQIAGVAQVSIGGQQKPAIRIQLDPAKLVAKGLSLEDVRIPLSVTTVDNPKGTINGPTRSFTIYTNDQLTQGQGLERRHRRLSQRRAAAGARHRPGGDRSAGHDAGGLGRRQARSLSRHLQAARRQRHRHRRPDQCASCRACRPPSRRRSRSSPWPTARRPSAPRSRTCNSPCCSRSRSW